MAIIKRRQKRPPVISRKLLSLIIGAVLVIGLMIGGFLWWRSEQLRKASANDLNTTVFDYQTPEEITKSIKGSTGKTLEELKTKDAKNAGLKYFPEYYAAGRALTADDSSKQALSYFQQAEKMISDYDHQNFDRLDFYREYMFAAGKAEDYQTARQLGAKALEEIEKTDTLDDLGKERAKSRVEFYLQQIEDEK